MAKTAMISPRSARTRVKKTAVANDCGALAPESVQIFGTPWREHAESPVEYGNREIFTVFSP